ncbi:MAG: chemotaxis protein CheW, partial [Anaerolineae bacterium]|nr:chemotaxis protein CheW [Anaerolineae bacterium]
VFVLGQETYGVDIGIASSIIALQPITAVPGTPPFVEGVTNLRGSVLPVIDLRKRLGLPAREATKETRIVLVQVNRETAGMLVDAVTEVLRVPLSNIEPPSPIVTKGEGDDRSAFITGIAKNGEQLIILLDLEKVFSTERQSVLETA